jgi:hypothetical protein
LNCSVDAKLTVTKTSKDALSWKTEYLSAKILIIQEYIKIKNTCVSEDGNGIEHADNLFNNKLYCVFENHNVVLTSIYEFLENEFVFMVNLVKKLTLVIKKQLIYGREFSACSFQKINQI